MTDKEKDSAIETVALPPSKKESTSSFVDIGMTRRHSATLGQFSVDNEIISIWRPINRETASKLSSQETNYIGKGINVKAKSSNFGPIAGDIPANARLSKLIETQAGQASIASAQENIDKILKTSNAERLALLREKSHQSRVTLFDANELNEKLFVTSIDKKINGQTIYYVNDAQHEIIFKDNKPLFVAQITPNHYQAYDYNTGSFSKNIDKFNADWKLEPVKVLAYYQYAVAAGEFVPEIRTITADYDELVSAPRKIYPLFNNRDELLKINIEASKSLSHEDLWLQRVLTFEEKLKQEERDLRYTTSMGAVNAWQQDLKAYLKAKTRNATNHGPEVNNPYPEQFSEGNYGVILSDGSMQVLHTEQEICDFINRYRALGYPLDINPKWGWEVDKAGCLFIPEKKFSWNNLYAELRAINDEITVFKLKANKPKSAVETHLILKGLELRYLKLETIINKKLAIDRLRFEPNIVYNLEENSPTNRLYLGNESTAEIKLREYISKNVCKLELERRQAKIAKLVTELLILTKSYNADYFHSAVTETLNFAKDYHHKLHPIINLPKPLNNTKSIRSKSTPYLFKLSHFSPNPRRTISTPNQSTQGMLKKITYS